MNIKYTAMLVFTLVLTLGACSKEQPAVTKESLTQLLKDNPSILQEAMKADPKGFAQTLQQVMQQAQPDPQKQFEEELAASLKNPLQPKAEPERRVGGSSAKVEVFVYTDFLCPFCGRGNDVVKQLKAKHGETLAFTVKHLPLPMHPGARHAARYYEAIGISSGYSKSEEWANLVYANQQEVAQLGQDEKKLEVLFAKYAAQVKVDGAKAKTALIKNFDKINATIDAGIQEAQQFDIQGTPGYIVGGAPIKGAYPLEAFDHVIQKVLTK